MKLMVTWQIHEGKLHDTLAQFAKMTEAEELEVLAGGKLLGRWHDLARGSGVAIYETDDPSAFTRYALSWNHAMDLDVAVVLDDDEARAVAKG